MAQFTVRNLEEDVKARLNRRAARHNSSMEEEARQILRNAVKDEVEPALRIGSRLAARIAEVGLDEELPDVLGRYPQRSSRDHPRHPCLVGSHAPRLRTGSGGVARPPAERILWVTSITACESRFGLALLPPGRGREALQESFQRLLADDLEHRVLPFDREAARQAALIGAARQHAERPVDMRDTQIAGIVVTRRATWATRNLRHFDDLPTRVVSPWA